MKSLQSSFLANTNLIQVKQQGNIFHICDEVRAKAVSQLTGYDYLYPSDIIALNRLGFEIEILDNTLRDIFYERD